MKKIFSNEFGFGFFGVFFCKDAAFCQVGRQVIIDRDGAVVSEESFQRGDGPVESEFRRGCIRVTVVSVSDHHVHGVVVSEKGWPEDESAWTHPCEWTAENGLQG